MTVTNFYLEGYNHILTNSYNLLEVCDSTAKAGKYGIARSLNVLAAEEAIKAAFVVTKHYFPDSSIQDFEEVFRNHIIKHKHLKSFVIMTENLKKRNTENLKMVAVLLETLENINEEVRMANEEIYESLVEEFQLYKSIAESEIKTGDILAWLESANTIKNEGLYVGSNNSKWVVPLDARKEDFEKERVYTNQILTSILNSAKTYQYMERNKKLLGQ